MLARQQLKAADATKDAADATKEAADARNERRPSANLKAATPISSGGESTADGDVDDAADAARLDHAATSAATASAERPSKVVVHVTVPDGVQGGDVIAVQLADEDTTIRAVVPAGLAPGGRFGVVVTRSTTSAPAAAASAAQNETEVDEPVIRPRRVRVLS